MLKTWSESWSDASIYVFLDWELVRFGDVARNVNTYERDPLRKGLDRYIGLEHLDPGSLRVSRWGYITEGTTFTKLFEPGQVLFPKRRVYQRKLAVAEFEGVCSGDILVFEASGDRLVPELLPFIVQTPDFFAHALETSAGSLSPRTRWRDLAEYKFVLPPKADQHRIVELLRAVDSAIDAFSLSAERLSSVYGVWVASRFRTWEEQSEPLGRHIEDSKYGPRFSADLYAHDGAVGSIRTTDLDEDGTIDYGTVPRARLDPKALASHLLAPGDVLITRSGTCGIAAVFKEGAIPMVAGAFLIRLRTKASLDPHYLREFFNNTVGKALTEKLAQGGVQRNIRGSSLLQARIPVPPREKQRQVVRTCDAIRGVVAKIRGHALTLQALRGKMLQLLLSSGVQR